MKLIIDGDNLLFKLNNEKLWVKDSLKTTLKNLDEALEDDSDEWFDKGTAAAMEYLTAISAIYTIDKITDVVRSCSMNNACEFCTHNTGYDEFGMCLCTEYVCTPPKNRCEKYEGKK